MPDATAAAGEEAFGLGEGVAVLFQLFKEGVIEAEFVGDDFGGVTFHTLLILPFARAQTTFDIHLAAFAQVFTGDLCQTLVNQCGLRQ